MTFYIMPEYAPKPNGMYAFEKRISLSHSTELLLHIFAASRYILRVDGKYVSEGPCRSHEQVRYYDEVPIFLSEGEHIFSFTVMHSTEFFTTVFDIPVPKLAFEALEGAKEILSTDASWECRYLPSYELTKYDMCSLPPYEIYTADKVPLPLPVKAMEKCVFKKDGYFTAGGAAYPYLLEKRPIPMIVPHPAVVLAPVRYGKDFIEYDAGEYMTAKVALDLDADSSFKIIYSECYEFEDGKHKRDDARGFLRGYFDKVKTADSKITYEPFWFRAFRYIRIEGDASAVRELRVSRVHYPFSEKGSFFCSDPLYNAMYSVSRNTLLSCCHEIVVDCPYYEQQQYEFDTFVQSTAIAYFSDDLRLIKKSISEFACTQRECGLLASIAPSSWVLQIIPGYSLLWIMMLRLYVEKTKDLSFASLYTGTVDAILGFFDRDMKEKGFLSRTRYWDFFDWVPAWENGGPPVKPGEAHTLYHFYYARALLDAAFLSRALHREALAKEYEMRYKEVISVVNRLCYNESLDMYSDGSEKSSYSMHTSIWAILAMAQSGEARERLLNSLYREDVEKNDLSMSFFLFRALEMCEREDLAFRFLENWKKMLEKGCTSWCENVHSPRSECHGWSCSPMYVLPALVLGVKEQYEGEILIKPCVGDLTFAEGNVPVRDGIISVRITAENATFHLSVTAPPNVVKRVILPNGKSHCFCGTSGDFTCELKKGNE